MKRADKKRTMVEVESDPNLIGYARVSTDDQNLDMQIEALRRAGVAPINIFAEKVSGVAKRRPELDFALKQCRHGSTFVVWKLDRVGRSLLHLLQFLQKLDAAGVGFKSLQDSIDTTTPVGRMILSVMGAIAEFERGLIVERTRAGVVRAQERGVRFGQPAKITPEIEAEMEALIADGEPISLIAKRYKVAVATVRLRFNKHRIGQIRARAERAKRKRTR